MKKLLRPLHRQRTRRRHRVSVLSSAELAEHFAIEIGQLERFLGTEGVAYHKDSQGELWATVEIPPSHT